MDKLYWKLSDIIRVIQCGRTRCRVSELSGRCCSLIRNLGGGIYHEHAQRKPVRKITPCLTSVFYGVIKSTKKTQKTLYTRTPPTPGFEPRMMGICERSDTTAMNGRDSTGYQAHLIVHCKPPLTTCDVNSVVKGIEHQASEQP